MDQTVAVCFFGITRSLTYTFNSIEQNILRPARDLCEPRVYSHFFREQRIDNPRSGEFGMLDVSEHQLLHSDWLQLEDPEACLQHWDFEGLKAHGDIWGDEFRSLRNLVHQLHSLNAVTEAALANGAEVCLFCRPDLRYHQSLSRPIRRALRAQRPLVQLPYWQAWNGLNDRFAICTGREAIRAYGQRVALAAQYCHDLNAPLYAEGLVRYALASAEIPVRTIRARASRVRFDGTESWEEFLHPRLVPLKHWSRATVLPVLDRTGLRPFLKRLRLH